MHGWGWLCLGVFEAPDEPSLEFSDIVSTHGNIDKTFDRLPITKQVNIWGNPPLAEILSQFLDDCISPI